MEKRNLRTTISACYKTLCSRRRYLFFSRGYNIFRKVTYLTVQVDDDKHITLQPEFLQYINHSCSPTVFFDTTMMQLVCLAEVNTGDEFTFFYPSTEWEMVQPFTCYCGSSNCLNTIEGASRIKDDVLEHYRLTDFIKRKVKNRQQY